MPEKNQMICAVTDALGSNGEGIVRHEGVTFFVPYCLPGEKIRFRVLKVKDKIGYGKIEEVLTPAEERVREVPRLHPLRGMSAATSRLSFPAAL